MRTWDVLHRGALLGMYVLNQSSANRLILLPVVYQPHAFP